VYCTPFGSWPLIISAIFNYSLTLLFKQRVVIIALCVFGKTFPNKHLMGFLPGGENFIMKSRKGIGGMGILAIAALAVVGFVGANQAGLLSAAGGDNGQVDDDGVASLQLKAQDTLADSQTFVAANYEVVNSDGQAIASGTLSSSSYTKVSDLDENTDYTVNVYDDDGSASDYYFNSKQVTTSETNKYSIVETQKEGTISNSLKEDDGAENDGTITLSTGETDTVSLEMRENTADAAFQKPVVFVKTNDTSAISDVEVSGASAVQSVPTRLSTYADGYSVGVAAIEDFTSETVDVQITRDESDTSSATVSLTVADQTQFQDNQGAWTEGFEDVNDAEVGASDATSTVTVN